jgi:hypothetical protein
MPQWGGGFSESVIDLGLQLMTSIVSEENSAKRREWARGRLRPSFLLVFSALGAYEEIQPHEHGENGEYTRHE